MKILSLVLLLASAAAAEGKDDDLVQSIRDIFDVNVEENTNSASALFEKENARDDVLTELPAPQMKMYTQKEDDEAHTSVDQYAAQEKNQNALFGEDFEHSTSSFNAPDILDKEFHPLSQSRELFDPFAQEERRANSQGRRSILESQQQAAASGSPATKSVAVPASSIPAEEDDTQALKAELAPLHGLERRVALAFEPVQQSLPNLVPDDVSSTHVASVQRRQPPGVASAIQTSAAVPLQSPQPGVVAAVVSPKPASAGLPNENKALIVSTRLNGTLADLRPAPVASVPGVQPAQAFAGMAAAQVDSGQSGQLKASLDVATKKDTFVSVVKQSSVGLPAESKVAVPSVQANLRPAALPSVPAAPDLVVQPAQAPAAMTAVRANSVAPVSSLVKQAQLKQDAFALTLKQALAVLPAQNAAAVLSVQADVPPVSLSPMSVEPVLGAQPLQASAGLTAAAAPVSPLQSKQSKAAPPISPAKQFKPKQPFVSPVTDAAVVPVYSQVPAQDSHVRSTPAALSPMRGTLAVQRAREPVGVEEARVSQVQSGQPKDEAAVSPVSKLQPEQNAVVSPSMQQRRNLAVPGPPAGQLQPVAVSAVLPPAPLLASLPSMQPIPVQALPSMLAPTAPLVKQVPVPTALPVTAMAHAQTFAASMLAEENRRLRAEAAGLKADMAEVRELLMETQRAMKSVGTNNVSQEGLQTKNLRSSNASSRPPRLSQQAAESAGAKDTWTSKFFSQLRSFFAAPPNSIASPMQQPSRKPQTFANFWLPESSPLAHTPAALLAVQKPRLQHRHRRHDFMEARTLADDMHEISDPFAQLEDENRRESRHLEHHDKDLQHKTLKLDRATRQKPQLVAMLHGGHSHMNDIWGDLERQDEFIQKRVDELDNPHYQRDLQTYQQLNRFQDDSMTRLERDVRGSPRLQRHIRHA